MALTSTLSQSNKAQVKKPNFFVKLYNMLRRKQASVAPEKRLTDTGSSIGRQAAGDISSGVRRLFSGKGTKYERKKATVTEIKKMVATSGVETNLSSKLNESEIMSRATPANQYNLYRLHKDLEASHMDQFGNPRLTPRKDLWFTGRETIPMFDVDGNYVSVEDGHLVAPPIYYGEVTSVYKIKNAPGKVIRYHFHCIIPMANHADPTAVDYWFLKHLEPTGIVPKVYYFSDSIAPPQPVETLFAKVKSSKCDKSDCIPRVRYAILEEVGATVHGYIVSQPERRATFANAIRMGGQMVGLAEKIHSLSIVHGDSHMGNFAFRENKIIMLDFGRGEIISESEQMERCMRNPSSYWVSPRISPWEMQKYSYSYRDDVYRIIQGMAIAIHGYEYNHFLDHLHDWEKMPGDYYKEMRDYAIDLKLKGYLFEIPTKDTQYPFPSDVTTSFSLQGRVPDAVLADVRNLLAEILALVMNVDLFTKPDYSAIKQKLVSILNLVEGDSPALANMEDAFEMYFATI